ncbi:Dam family site-specific DNA-(adenine-N6)-methyltransferase [uncultured Helicobacter sp.]|uniref:DNA adenine methylase n=1 Tax=uncultured Helicobacter sp. TaxID=175537 RepID=UPI00259052A9|nr:Dam family site-specific DNA-(adenine-N6)-methyltransferase [uncultured Helicobacter sp.]
MPKGLDNARDGLNVERWQERKSQRQKKPGVAHLLLSYVDSGGHCEMPKNLTSSKYTMQDTRHNNRIQPTLESRKNIIQSPLNYTGGKFTLLSQILPLFPKQISTFVDLFCGGGNVGVNIQAQNIILNDENKVVMELLKLFQKEEFAMIKQKIDVLINEFKLSNSTKFGYEFYKCDSAKGLSSYNKQGFLNLRKAYNEDKDILKLFVLIIFSFNNQIRFNAKGEFNLPCGKRDFNAKMQAKLQGFIQALKSKNISFKNEDFRTFKLENLDKNAFIYMDPPYFLCLASYNENKAWSEQDEKDLLEFIQNLESKNIKFALSNVLTHKGKEHKLLQTWLKENPCFKVHFLNKSYKNCNYQSKRLESREVLVVNYGS